MPRSNHLILAIILVIVIVLVFAGGYFLGVLYDSNGGPFISVSGNDTSDKERLEAVEEAWFIIFREYVDKSRLNSANMSRAAIVNMIETLDDPYSSYLDEK